MRFLRTIAHPSHSGFCTPSRTHPALVFMHHRVPVPWRCLYTVAHPPNSGFCTPSHTHPTLVFTHHRALVPWRFLYGGFRTPLPTHPTAVFVHHRTRTQLWFSYTIAAHSIITSDHGALHIWSSSTIACLATHRFHCTPTPAVALLNFTC